MPTPEATPCIVMAGTRPGARSGIASVVAVYVEEGLFHRWNVHFLGTHADGTRARKAWIAARAVATFLALLAGRRVALLHVLMASGASFWRKALLILFARLAGVPYVVHLHCGKFLDFHARGRTLRRRAIDQVLAGARQVIALSPQDQEALVRLAPRASVMHLPNPVGVPPARARLTADPPTVLFLGVLREEKGVYDLLQAWARVGRAHPRARLVLGGDGERDAVAARARALGIADRIEMPGWVTGEAKARWIDRAWAFCLPSHAEALPMALLECLAAGLPAVATRVGGIPLALEHGANGLLVEKGDPVALADALGRLLGDAPYRIALGREARRRARRQFGAPRRVAELEQCWARLAPAARRAPGADTAATCGLRPRARS